jgi:hypothetical protein
MPVKELDRALAIERGPVDPYSLEGDAKTKALLDEQQKFTILIPDDQNADERHNLIPVPIMVNGYRYEIARNESVEVPETIYIQAVIAGYVQPLRKEDQVYRPRKTVPTLSETAPGL